MNDAIAAEVARPPVVFGRALRALAMRLVFPLLLVNVTVANQLWTLGPLFISQVLFFWPAIVCAFIIVLLSWPRSLWPLALLAGVIGARMIGANQSEGWLYLLYAVPLHGLFLLAGSIVALKRRELLFRQLRFYLALSVPLMFLQVAGAGDWTLALNTETTAVEEGEIAQARVTHPTLFVPASESQRFAIGQSRPSGLMHANNVLSFVIMLALAVQLGRVRTPRLTWADALFCAAMVLAMAKIVVLSFLLMVLWQWLTGSRALRRRVRRLLAVTVLLYATYAVLFPGLFFHHFDLFHISYSVYVRVNDFLGTLDPESPIVQFLKPKLEGTSEFLPDEEGARLSGYAMVSRAVPFLILAVPIAYLALRPAFRAVRRRSPEASAVTLLVLGVALLFPAAVPYWASPLYWFVLGIGLMPMVWFCSHQLRHIPPGLDSRRSTRSVLVPARQDLQKQ